MPSSRRTAHAMRIAMSAAVIAFCALAGPQPDARAQSTPALNVLSCAAKSGDSRYEFRPGNRFRIRGLYAAAFDFGWPENASVQFQVASFRPFRVETYRRRPEGGSWAFRGANMSQPTGTDHRHHFRTPHSRSEEVFRIVVIPTGRGQTEPHRMRVLWRIDCSAGGLCPSLGSYGFRDRSTALNGFAAAFGWSTSGGTLLCVPSKAGPEFYCGLTNSYQGVNRGFIYRAERIGAAPRHRRYSLAPCFPDGARKPFTADAIFNPPKRPMRIAGRPGALPWDGRNLATGLRLNWFEW